jgi:hypothetical protein
LVLLLLLLLLLPPNKPPSKEPNPARGLPAGLVEFELPLLLLLLLLPGESPPGTLIPLLLLLLLPRFARAIRSPRSVVVPAAAMPLDAPSWFIHMPASAIGLLALVIEGIPVPGGITTFITPGSAKSAAAAALLLLLLLLSGS